MMAWKYELENAKKIFKTGTTKQKVEYIMDYYKWHIIIVLFVLIFIGNTIYTNLTRKDYVLQGIFLSTSAETETVLDLEKDFLKKYPINSSSEDIFFDSSLYYRLDTESIDSTLSYQAIQVLTARIAAGEIDFLVADDVTLNNICYNQYFTDLSKILSEDQIKKYEPYFLYYDREVMEKMNSTDDTTKDGAEISLPNPSKPEQMKDPVPVMINITETETISILYPGFTENYAIAFLANTKNTEKALEFLEYLID